MKFKLFSLLLVLSLTACGNIALFPSDSNSDTNSGGDTSSDQPISGTVDIYGINDFHGAINSTSGSQMGILKLASFLKEEKSDGNTIVINSGDYWQGTLESNINKGKLLTEISNEVEFDAFTIGNHEFDWGDQFIKQNALLKSNSGYSTPVLGANIYNYDITNKKVLNFANDLGAEYTISELDNGIKVGIIGYIGPGQISSIVSNNVDHLSFIDPFNVIKNTSLELRELGCHIVILSGHEDCQTILSINQGGTYISEYVDVVFGAHTHQFESGRKNGVPYMQAGENGEAIGKISLNYSSDKGVSVKSMTTVRGHNIDVTIDEEIQDIYDKYIDEIDDVSSMDIATFSSNVSRTEASNLMAASLADYAIENDIDVSYTLINTARTSIDTPNAKYTDVYKAYPFDNVVYIAEVSGIDLYYELRYGYFYRLDSNALDTTKRYKIAVIDYVLTHRDDDRQYDNFKNFTIIDKYEKENYELYTYRDVCVDWLLSLKGQTISLSNFSSNSNRHSSDYIFSDVILADNPYVA